MSAEMKHVSVNCCTFSIDLVVTDPSTGRVKMVQWTWEEVEKFVNEHGVDMTDKTRGLVDGFWSDAKEKDPDG